MENNKVVLADGTVVMDITDTTATASDVATGKYFYTAAGVRTEGTNQGGGTVVVTDTTDPVSGGTIREITAQALLNQSKTVTPTTSQQTVTPDAGYSGLGEVIVNAMPSGSATTPATTISVTPTISVSSAGVITASASGSQSVTPTVTSGYVSSGTAGTITVSGSNTSQLTTQAAQTIYPSSSDQSISSGRYLTGAQTIKAVTTTNLTADNIKSGVTVQVGDSADSDRVLSITGTYSGGGSSDIATGTLTVASNVNTSTSTKITDTSTIGFTPTKFFFWKDSRTATNSHVHQATFTTIGSYYIRTMTRYSSNALSTSGNTNNWTTQTAGYLYYNSNTIYIRSSSSYILSSGTWHWVAVK